MANTAPQTNEPGTFDSDGLPIHGLVIPGQTTMAAVAGSVLATDPTSSDQYTVPHLPLAAVPRYADVTVGSGSSLAVAATLTGVTGRTLYVCQIVVETNTFSTAQALTFTFGGLATIGGTPTAPVIVVPTTGLQFSRTYAVPLPASTVGGNVTLTGPGATANGAIRWEIIGFAL